MIELFTADTPNGKKISIMLEEIGYNYKLTKKFRKIQLPLDFKKKKSHFVINNNFNKKSIKKCVKDILQKI